MIANLPIQINAQDKWSEGINLNQISYARLLLLENIQ